MFGLTKAWVGREETRTFGTTAGIASRLKILCDGNKVTVLYHAEASLGNGRKNVARAKATSTYVLAIRRYYLYTVLRDHDRLQ